MVAYKEPVGTPEKTTSVGGQHLSGEGLWALKGSHLAAPCFMPPTHNVGRVLGGPRTRHSLPCLKPPMASIAPGTKTHPSLRNLGFPLHPGPPAPPFSPFLARAQPHCPFSLPLKHSQACSPRWGGPLHSRSPCLHCNPT